MMSSTSSSGSLAECGRYAALLESLFEEQLDAEERPELQAHLERCGDCSRRLEEWRKLRRLVRQSVATEAALPSGGNVVRLIEQRAGRNRSLSRRVLIWGPALAAVAGLAIIVATHRGPPQEPVPIVEAGVTQELLAVWIEDDDQRGRLVIQAPASGFAYGASDE